MQQKGYAFYFEIVPPDEINRNMEINEAGFRFYYGQPVEKDLPCPSSITFISTYREKKILQLSVKGLSNTEVGETLFIAPNTVKFHKEKLFEKLHAENITEAVDIKANLRLI